MPAGGFRPRNNDRNKNRRFEEFTRQPATEGESARQWQRKIIDSFDWRYFAKEDFLTILYQSGTTDPLVLRFSATNWIADTIFVYEVMSVYTTDDFSLCSSLFLVFSSSTKDEKSRTTVDDCREAFAFRILTYFRTDLLLISRSQARRDHYNLVLIT